MSRTSNYPVYPAPNVPSIVYVPQMGSSKVSRSVSVIAIILLIALLFVGMNLLQDDAFYKEEKLDWNMGYIDADGRGVEYNAWTESFFGFGNTYGMYTSNAIEIKHGVTIHLDFGSNLTYQVLLYDQNDKFLGTMGDPKSNGQIVDEQYLTGKFATAKFLRIYAYERDTEMNGINPVSKGLNWWEMISRASGIRVSVKQSDLKDDIADIV